MHQSGRIRCSLRFLVPALLAGTVWANAQSGLTVGPWTVDMPAGAQASQQNDLRAFKVGDINFIFTPAQPLNGKTLDQVAQATIADLSGGKGTSKKTDSGTQDGREYLTYLLTLPESASNTQLYFLHFQKQGTQWGMALGNAKGTQQNVEKVVRDILTVLNSAAFTGSGQATPQQAQGGGSSGIYTPALPAVAWPAPRADRVVLNAAKITYPAARKLGLNPYEDLLPDTFDCYRTNDKSADALRPMNPTPEARVTIQQGGTYSFNAGRGAQTGNWKRTGTGSNRKIVLSGVLEGEGSDNNIYLNAHDDLGQRFRAFSKGIGYLVCLQQGPRADALRVEMARAKIGNESFTCVEKDGKPYQLKLTAGTYTTPRGNGRLRSGFRLDDRANLETVLTFTGGPYDSNDGKISEDDAGNRVLDIQYSVSKGGAFSKETTTSLVARCTARTSPKPQALYGPAKAPATGAKGGPDGFYVGYRRYTTYIGQIPTTSYGLQLSYFTPTGYFIDDADPDETGVLPDCTRTKPNGEPFCQRYEIKGKTIRTQDSDGDWNDPDDFAMTKETVEFDNTTLYRVTPLKAMPAGIFTSDKLNATGVPGSPNSGNISTYTNAYQFNGGQFAWRSDSSSSTTVGNIGYQPGMLASAGSSRTDAGSGKYALNGYWLTLTFSDGRVRRVFTYPRPAALAKADKSMTQELNIGGRWLNRAR